MFTERLSGEARRLELCVIEVDTAMTAAVDGEIKDLARWLALDLMLPG